MQDKKLSITDPRDNTSDCEIKVNFLPLNSTKNDVCFPYYKGHLLYKKSQLIRVLKTPFELRRGRFLFEASVF